MDNKDHDVSEAEKLYNRYKNIDNKCLDFFLVIGKRFLNKVDSGKKLHYFEKRAATLMDVALKIKKERLFNNT